MPHIHKKGIAVDISKRGSSGRKRYMSAKIIPRMIKLIIRMAMIE